MMIVAEEKKMNRMAAFFRIKPGTKLMPGRGAYTAIAMFLPLLILAALGQRELGAMAMLGALLVAFANFNIPYRQRAWLLGIATVGGALLTALGRLISGPWWLVTLEIFLVVFISGLLSMYGLGAAVVGLLLTIPFVISLAAPGGPATALPAAGGYLLGGAILMLFALGTALLKQHQHISEVKEHPTGTPGATRATLVSHLTFTTPLSRYTLLRAAGAASAAAIGWGLGASYPFWATLTVIICTREDRETSLFITAQYIIATAVGAILANWLIIYTSDPLVIGLNIVAVTFITFTIKDLNYAIQVFFMTNLVLLLSSLSTSGRSFAEWRVESILIGAVIVLVIILVSDAFIFGKRERQPLLQQE
jgi:uncharacterized membrane protein YccC